ncbi:hypothetical protein EDS67_25275 [candidate division KSB1 bacterium]|nr:MAG: hypothetical protein EDS67_25275 [candidate division KSB1 bacterium]MBC6949940.1 hypothetical protein [candidate division KSB1 bacterium]MCE7944610.1 hypothetical protein [Chlorobi bacterium CHB1]MDL1879058.1 hypothetical protein [Cytophagia bacterium CHB2]RIK69101.1 MAG: hypothetical protein DCC62_24005 [candidate division KSB1 bacterium]
MNKTCLAVAVLIFAAATVTFASEEIMVKKILLNGKTKTVSIAAHNEKGALFLEAQRLAQALGFALKRQSGLAILCTETACLPFTIGEKEAREKDGQLFISAAAFFTSVGSTWEFDEKAGALAIDLPDELPTSNAPVDVTVGSTAPGFLVTAADGKEIRLADFRGKKNVVLEFFRSGSW